MRVCIVPYGESWTHQGGHKTQQLQTARALRTAGVDVIIGDPALAAISQFDIVHFFGDPTPLLSIGRPRGKLIVSPVYFPAYVQLGAPHSTFGKLGIPLCHLRLAFRCARHSDDRAMQWGRFRAALQAIASADTIVVNSWAEWILLEHDFARYLADIRLPPVHVAYSGVDDIYFSGSAERGRHLVGSEPFVLCVGRPEPRKNQIGLVRAMRTVPRRLVLVGEVLPRNEWILEYCRSLLPSLIHISDLEPSSLRDVYAAADAHVLPSFYETTGLATLEALAAGTSAVAGKGPCVHEYFGDSVVLVDPQSPRDIRSGILRALNLPIGGERAKAAQFSWSRTARELIEAYTA